MAVTSGAVVSIKVSKADDLATFMLEHADTGAWEIFILWSPAGVPFDHIYHATWLSMLRDAIARSLRVQVGHPDDGALVTELAIWRPST